MRNTIVSILYSKDWADIAEITVANAKSYCGKHGYKLDVIELDKWGCDYGYYKLDVIKNLFKNNKADIIWSIDADCLITNHNYKIEDFLEEEFDFFITKDVNGINGGSFISINTKWTIDFIEWLLKKRGQEKMHCEQDAIRAYMEEYPISPICVLPHPSINSYHYHLYPEFESITSEELGNWHSGNFVLHLPGISIEKRLEILKKTPIVI